MTGNLSYPPVILQIDSQVHTEKLDFIRRIGFDFVACDDRVSCNRTAVNKAKDIFENGSLRSLTLVTPLQRYLMFLDFCARFWIALIPQLRHYKLLLFYFAED